MKQSLCTAAGRTTLLRSMLAAALLALSTGCGGNASSTAANAVASSRDTAEESAARPVPSPAAAVKRPEAAAPTAGDVQPAAENAVKRDQPRSLADLLNAADDPPEGAGATPTAPSTPPTIDNERAAAAGIRKLTGKHLTLYTDLPPAGEVDELPHVFDLAVPQWCQYFGVDYATLNEWRIYGYLMSDAQRFQRGGLLPDNLPEFLHGIQRDYELWVREQPSAYYRRHLLLHEGTHGFMNLLLGGSGPPWYAEGMAELLATHRWRNGELALRYFPQDKKETPMWGRIKIVQDEFRAQRGKRIREIMNYERGAHLRNAPYGWCWAATSFFDNHPRCQKAFRDLLQQLRQPDETLNRAFDEAIGDQWPQVERDWVLFVVNLDYGYDIAREAVQDAASLQDVPEAGVDVFVSAERGWQSSGYRLQAGVEYQLLAEGRFQIADKPEIWWCEPGGVTIRYHNGQPLGILLGAIAPETPAPNHITPLASPQVVGLQRVISPREAGVLYLRVNDFPNELGDNAGQLHVRIAPR